MNKILPPVTLPWPQVIIRRHKPPEARYTTFRACLRWEFGFSCAFCLLHEADVTPSGAEGWRVMAIEHFVPQSRDRSRINDYTNCFYICGLCNSSRRNTENYVVDGPSLLNPCDCAWGEHFEVIDDEIRPLRACDVDAGYTLKTYDFNDPRKVRCRSMRRRMISQCYGFLNPAYEAHEELLDRAENEGDSEAVDLAREVHSLQRLAWADLLQQFQAIPSDANAICRCGEPGNLPPGLDSQTTPMPS